MCGIVGIVGRQEVGPRLIDGLKRLEYRGYDSAGVASVTNGHIQRVRGQGKLINLSEKLSLAPLQGNLGIGHTRWATHGGPTEVNAHPHATDRVAVVHNGIIENYQELRLMLEAAGHVFSTETDTEIVAVLITEYLNRQMSPQEAVATGLKQLEGAYALAMIFAGEHDLMIAARKGSPLALGYGDGEMYLGSDALALAPWTDQVCYLEDGDWAEIRRDGVIVHDADDAVVERALTQSQVADSVTDKGDFPHYMLKEIHEQPAVVAKTLQAVTDPAALCAALPPLPFELTTVPKITIIACGTAYYAGMVGKYWLEQTARIPVEIDVASEFRYREPPLPKGGVALIISQSGETADTLAALRHCKSQGQHVVAVVNVPESSIAREADVVLPTYAGPEVGVASTKAFTTQLSVLAGFAIAAARSRATIDATTEVQLVSALLSVPAAMSAVLQQAPKLQAIAEKIAQARGALFIGRGSAYPMALEGALKLKEITYIHAEGQAAGEMKHGPIALIDENLPVIVVAPTDRLFDKTLSNVNEVMARGGQVVLLSDGEGIERVGDAVEAAIELPAVDPYIAPLVYAIPLQLLAYYAAVAKGTDVDQPRNLAKSVTVE